MIEHEVTNPVNPHPRARTFPKHLQSKLCDSSHEMSASPRQTPAPSRSRTAECSRTEKIFTLSPLMIKETRLLCAPITLSSIHSTPIGPLPRDPHCDLDPTAPDVLIAKCPYCSGDVISVTNDPMTLIFCSLVVLMSTSKL